MWIDIATRQIGVFINVSIEQIGQSYLIGTKNIICILDGLVTSLQYNESNGEIISRLLNLLSKLSRDPRGAQQIAESKNLMLRALLYFNRDTFPIDMVLNSLRILHNSFKSAPNFR